jgi:UDP-glucose:(heptosyl)LPS alpha-1,3-glucosyltransferase
MRLALVRQDYDPQGAVERDTERALEALIERNVAISLYTRHWPQTRSKLIEPVICNPLHAGALWRDWGFARAACGLIRRSNPSLVESHDRLLCCDVYRAGDGVHAVRLEERLRAANPLERLAVRSSPRHRYLLHMERRLYASPWLRAVICKSAMVKDEIHDRFAVPAAKLVVIHNPVDSECCNPGLRAGRSAILERHRIDSETLVYLVVAKDFARCGVATAMDALARLPAPAHLIVVGDDDDIEMYRKRAHHLGIADRVSFAGAQDDPRPYYGAADVFVWPSQYDPSPDTVLEAMACGLPVVTSTKSGAASLLDEHGGGLACRSDDVEGFAAHMQALAEPGLRARLSDNARRAILPLTPSAITLQLVLLYRDLLGAAPPAAPGARSGVADSARPATLAPLSGSR